MADTGVSSVLNDLIQTAKDGEEGFRHAAQEASDTSLKQLFAKYASQRNEFVQELQRLVQSTGGKPAHSGHISATLHRGWMTLKDKISKPNDRALIEECERGEDAAKRNYEEAINKSLPPELKTIVERQYAGVQEAHGTIRNLKYSGRTSVATT